MNSSMLAGERRWASARRGGMTVLGKVTVPKPINLPSQRLENHGLDPNVEIIPKGTVGWARPSSSSGSNPWTSSSLSPKADGGSGSPSHLSGRPSSGGSGTRSSTSGSDRTHDPASNAWASNSRPSSASGSLSSNHTSSTSLRPRSAENRPNSSQLSRFAEPVSKNSATWGSSVTAERLGVKSLMEESFSLTSGDFPTLGSEKDNPVKSIESEDCRPNSACGIVQAKEDDVPHADIKHGTVDTWRAENSPHAEDDIHPGMEKWQGDPHQYFNPNTAPQHFDGWRGPPMNGPAGGWYGGRPRVPAFGSHVPPGGFPMEPFPYYRPQHPPPPLAGSQPVPPPGPRGPHPKNEDLYRPQMHEPYSRPGMQFRPNLYPGPPGPMPFEGYYGPPMGYCSSEHDIPYRGRATGLPVYNGYRSPAPDISNSHGRAAAQGPNRRTLEQVEAGHSEDTYGPKRVHLNSHSEYEQKEEGVNWEQNAPHNILHPGKNRFPVSSRRNEWGAEEDAEEDVSTKRMAPRVNPSNIYGKRIHSADTKKVKSFEGMRSEKGVDDNWTNKSEGLPSFPPVVPQLSVTSEKDAPLPSATKKTALMHRVDGVNARVCVSDGLNDSTTAYSTGEGRTGSQIVDMKVNSYTKEVGNGAGSSQVILSSRNYTSAPDEVSVHVADNPMQPIAVVSRRSQHGGHPRIVDGHGKGKFSSQDGDGWRRKPLITDSSSAVIASSNESTPVIDSHGRNNVGEASESSIIDPAGKIERDSVEVGDSAVIQAQRAKMREIAKQRTLQLQKEEEERVREQKAKALAKLEELDRKRIAGEPANQKGERTLIIGDIPVEQQSHTVIGTVIAELKTNESGFNLVLSPAAAQVKTESSTNQEEKFGDVSRISHPAVIQQKVSLESNLSPLPINEDSADGSTKVVSQPDDGGMSRHKRAGYKQKQNNMSQKNLNGKTVSSTTFDVQKDTITNEAGADMHGPPPSDTRQIDSVPSASNTVVEPSAQQRKSINRSHKPKPKPDEKPSAPALPPVTSDSTHGESIDNGGSNKSVSNLDSSVSTVSEPDKLVQTQELSSSLPSEESQTKVSNQWKPHPSRRTPKNQQAHKFTDKHHVSDTVVWAPKAKASDEVSQASVQESAKGNNVVPNSLKGKRAEMERYVPKPQLAQQGNAPPLSSRSNEGAAGEQSGSAISANSLATSSAAEHVRSNFEISVGDSSHNKNRKDNGTWRQRGPKDSSQLKGAHTAPSPMSEPPKDVQQSKELLQLGTSEIDNVNTETKISGSTPTSTDTTTAAVSKNPSAKDQGAAGRGKRHQPKGPRSSGNNPDHGNTSYGEVDGKSSIDVNQMDKSMISKENRSFGERTSSQWQPKPNPNAQNNQQGSRNAGSESVALETNRIPRKDNPQRNVQQVPQQDKESSSFTQPQIGQSVKARINAANNSVARPHQDFERVKRPAPVKGRPYSPNQDPVGSGESPHANTDDQHQHNFTSGPRRTGRQNNRPVRAHESRGEWPSGHDNRPYMPARQRQNVQLEYQPVGPFKGEEQTDGGANSTDQRHRERGQGHMKREGNYYRR